jgi:hypothetical protein
MNGAEQPKILDAAGKPAQEAAKAPEGPKIVAQLTVTMFEDGNVNIAGPIANKSLCYGLLEVGKDLVRGYVDQANGPRVATPQQPGFFRQLLGKHSHVSAKRR